MTSLMTASNTSSSSSPTAEREPVPAANNNQNTDTNTTDTTISPITDLTQTNATSSTNGQNNTSSSCATFPNSISKIPSPLAALLTNNKPNQFQRSASLRLRGQNSNSLFNTHNTMADTAEHSDVNTTPTRQEHGANDVDETDDIPSTSTGRVSPRRKLVLNSHSSADGIHRRSLSLRRSHKTEPRKGAPCIAAILELTPKRLFRDDSPTKATETSTSAGAALNEREAPLGIDAENRVNGVDAKTTTANSTNCNMLEGSKDIRKMSTNLNGGGTKASSSTTTATAASAASTSTLTAAINATAATATTPTTPVRPATLAKTTGNGSPTTPTPSTSKVASAPRTPKTPTTPQQSTVNYYNQQQYSAGPSHSKQTHSLHLQYCANHTPLSSVPETRLTPKTPPVTPDSPNTYLEDDIDSLYSFATTTSGRSTMSCEHPYVARNGTTFSGRKMKYVVHCSNYAGQVGADYLTPTQRAQRQIRRLKELLCVARQELEQKDSEILRLTREVVELRLFKASLSSPEERSASSDAVTVREAELKTSQDVSPIVDMIDGDSKSSPRHIVGAAHHHHHHQHHNQHHHQGGSQLSTSEMQSSFADSGHFEDISVHSKDSKDCACGSDEAIDADAVAAAEAAKAAEYELQRQELISLYEQRIEELIRNQDTATSEMKRSHNDKVEALLQKLAECNTRYADIVPDYEHAKERIRELEKQLEDLQRKLAEHEEKQNKMYLHMYQKGQEAERIARADQALELAHRAPNKVSINELLHQLQSTQDELENIRAAECRNECGSNHALLTAKEAISLWVLGARKTIYRRLLEAQKNRTHVDPEVTLQFLKSAVYYFLTDKENSQGHLQAIESILEFTEAEKLNINRANTK